jgi:hypothetical protein
MNRKLLGFLGVRSRTAIYVGATLAIGLTGAQAACYNAQQQLSPQVISAFTNDPAGFLKQYPEGGAQFISRIRDLVASDPTTLDPILKLIGDATKDQKTAIGAALAQAARICVRTDQAFATDIQQAIAQTKDHDVVLAFTSTSGDQPTGAVGGGAGGAGGGTGGQTNPLVSTLTYTGPAQRIGNDPTPTPLFTYTSSVTGTSGTSTTTTTTSFFTISSPVSR